ncbi:MAG TPA: protein kinase [Flavisolibacter sp.]|nr:protein kinase [Flavisolibacter sp.]
MGKVFTITEGLQNLGALRTGGQGSVYKARRIGEIITAVKLLPTPIHSESPTDKHYTAFQNEVQKLKKVNEQPNPNVVKIISSGITETGSLPFIEMEFIEGPDLEELLKPPHEPVFTIKETIRVAEQLANALAHCHRLDVKHGDIKSNNVKFNIHSSNYVLLDFGLAVMSDEQRRTSLRQAGAIEFMAPEQSNGQMLFQTDVYSYGVILFELLAGTVPFPLRDQGETARNLVMLAHMEAPPPDLFELRRSRLPANWPAEKKDQEMQVPDWLVNMTYRCLEKRPENRFANGMAVYENIVRKSTLSASKTEWSAEKMRLENEKLLRENDALRQQLARYKSGEGPAVDKWEPAPRKSSSQSILLATLFTALIIAAIIFFALRGSREKSAASTKPGTETNQPRREIGQYKVAAARAYFHNEPDGSTRRNAYMTPSNDVVSALEEKNGYVYVEFTNSRGQTSKGWLRRQDLVTLSEWTENRNTRPDARPLDQDIQRQLQEARNLADNNQIKEALYIYSYLSEQEVPEAMYQYGNLALKNRHSEIDCDQAISLLNRAAENGHAPAKRTLGFLYIFAENRDVLNAADYESCPFEKNVIKGTQLLIQAVRDGDSTAKDLLDEINLRRDPQDAPSN